MAIPNWDEVPDQMIDVTLIDRPERPAREESFEETLEELAESIRQRGLLHAVILRPREGGRFEVVVGDRRCAAHVLLSKSEVRAKIADLSDEEVEEIKGEENAQQMPMNPLEWARHYHHQMVHYGRSAEQMYMKYGKSVFYFKNIIRLLELSEEMQQAMREEKISQSQALEIVQGKTDAARNLMFDYALKGSSARMLHEWRRSAERTGKDVHMQEVMEQVKAAKPQQNPSAGMICYTCSDFTDYSELTYIHLCRGCRGHYDVAISQMKEMARQEQEH